jgi:hypothetical protein
MDPVEEFRKHANECRRTACLTKDRADRARWELMADRWERCVETAQSAIATAANARHKRTRQVRPLNERGSE